MKPLILDYKVNRSEDVPAICYEYDIEKSLNVVRINGKTKPFIEVNGADVALTTKTKIRQESDDDHLSMLELETKSQTRNEGDDRESMLLELSTKTLVARERDDERKDYLMELTTKTRVKS